MGRTKETNMSETTVGDLRVGGPTLTLLAGPCVIESDDHALAMAKGIKAITDRLGIGLVYKSSFDKANRTSVSSFRGLGTEAGLAVLDRVKRELGVPVVTDIHESNQAAPVAQVADVLQIPAFLCRQTDLLVAAAATGQVVNVKKGQFLSAPEMQYVVAKLTGAGAAGVLVTERGSMFGYNDLIVDFRSLPLLRSFGVPVVFDATHSVQSPGGAGGKSGGRREFVPYLARAAVAVGVDALFMEVHDDPDHAPSDGPNMVRLDDLEGILTDVLAVRAAVKPLPPLAP
jgi:2-dehydro-3-deoxyphosphooctonate aldolase (KDO 8-P synthase)